MGLVCAFAGAARAAEGQGAGQLTSFACGVVAPKSRIDVQLMDDTPRDKAVRDAIAAELGREGYIIAADAPIRVTFEAEIARTLDQTRQGYLGKLNSTNRDTEFQLNLWSSKGDSVLGGVQRPNDNSGPNMIHLTIFAHDKANGRCLWQGEATHPMEGTSVPDAVKRILPAVLKHFGQTVGATAFSLDD
jgi:hypothetical protein